MELERETDTFPEEEINFELSDFDDKPFLSKKQRRQVELQQRRAERKKQSDLYAKEFLDAEAELGSENEEHDDVVKRLSGSELEEGDDGDLSSLLNDDDKDNYFDKEKFLDDMHEQDKEDIKNIIEGRRRAYEKTDFGIDEDYKVKIQNNMIKSYKEVLAEVMEENNYAARRLASFGDIKEETTAEELKFIEISAEISRRNENLKNPDVLAELARNVMERKTKYEFKVTNLNTPTKTVKTSTVKSIMWKKGSVLSAMKKDKYREDTDEEKKPETKSGSFMFKKLF